MPPLEVASYVLTLLGLSTLLLVVALKNINTKVNQSFIVFNALVMLYVATAFASGFSQNIKSGLILSRLILMFASFIPLAFYIFAVTFTNYRSKKNIFYKLILIVTPVLAATAFLPVAVKSVQTSPYGIVLKQTGPAMIVFVLFFVLVFFRCFQILESITKKSEKSVRNQIRLMMFGLSAALLINLVTQIMLPVFHIATWGAIVGIPSVLIFVGSVGYAILKHKLFDIKTVLLRSLGYIVTIVVVISLYSALILGISDFLFPSLNLSITQQAYFVASAVILTFTFRPVVKLIERVTDSIFYRDRYDPQELINTIGRVLASEIDLESLTSQVSKLLDHFLKIKQTDIVVLNNGKIYFESANVFSHVLKSFHDDMEKLDHSLLITDELPEGEHRAIMRKYGIACFVTLKTGNEKIGYLLFSEKNSGTSFGNVDISVIKIVADELAIAIQNSRAYSQIQQFNITLQEKINEATEQLQQANSHLKESDAVKDDFISLASHQLSTPLAVIDGYLSLAAKGVYGDINPTVKKSLSAALERAQVMKNLLADLLDISRMTAGKFILEKRPSNINELVDKEVGQLLGQAAEQHVTLLFHPPNNPIPPMNIDAHKISQAIMNLIVNAIMYTPNGQVDVYLEFANNIATVRVVDNGIGVPEVQKEKLFTKFFRADNAKDERPTGTGIGLYLVKKVVEDHGGTIFFDSKLGLGSTFGFNLPLEPANVLSGAEIKQKVVIK